MNKEELIMSLGNFGYPIFFNYTTRNIDVLNELADSENPRLLEGFPVVLAYCAYKNQNINLNKLLSMHDPKSTQRINLEKLLLISSELLSSEELMQPPGLEELAMSLKKKHGNLLLKESFYLNENISLSTERLRNTLKRYTSKFKKPRTYKKKAMDKQRRSFQLNLHLSTLFSPKQKEIVLKKYHGQPLTKTEQEYFSRKIKKKLEAISNSELKKMARKVLKNHTLK